MTVVIHSFPVQMVIFYDVRVNSRYQTVEVEVWINMLEMSDCSEHKAMLMCCLSVDIRMAVCQGFTPRNVAHVLGIYVKAVHVKYCLHFSGVRQQWLPMALCVGRQVRKMAMKVEITFYNL